MVTRLNKDHFDDIVRHGSFADLTVCITDFCKVSKYQKISLLAIGMLRGVITTMLNSPETHLTASGPVPPTSSPEANSTAASIDDPMIKFWFPVLFSFYDIIMNGEDLEVRRLYVKDCSPLIRTHRARLLAEPLILFSQPSRLMDQPSGWTSGTLCAKNSCSPSSRYFDLARTCLDSQPRKI
jgi:brefeldin A-inhibited guanine nucleotide-exchange protein